MLRAPVRGDTYLLVDVRPHDEANRLARRIAFKANTATGAIQVWDVEAVEELHDTLTEGSAGTAARANYFDRFPDKDLDRLGLDEQSISLLRAAPDLPPEAIADMACRRLPTPEADVVTMLASGYTVEEAWKEVAGDQPAPAHPDDVDAAITHPASTAYVHVVADIEELADVLRYPLDVWRVFLHPVSANLPTDRRSAARHESPAGREPGRLSSPSTGTRR